MGLLYGLGQHFSIASAIGFIALAVWLLNSCLDFLDALVEGAVLRVRPKAMTVAAILAGLIPILIGHGTGSETMARIAAPMVGGMLTAPLLSLFVLPVSYVLIRTKQVR